MAESKFKLESWKLPFMFLGGLIGIALGGITGAMFTDLGYVSSVNWEAILIFFGALAGVFVGWKIDI